MAAPIKKELENQISDSIEQKFDLVFDKLAVNRSVSSKTELNLETDNYDLNNFHTTGNETMSGSSEKAKKVAPMGDNNDLVFTLDLSEDDSPELPALPEVLNLTQSSENDNGTLAMPDYDNLELGGLELTGAETQGETHQEIQEETQKTIFYDLHKLPELPSEELNFSEQNDSSDLMSTEESKENIETTIKSILSFQNSEAAKRTTPALGTNDFDNDFKDDFENFYLDDEDIIEQKIPEISPVALKVSDIEEFDLDSVAFADSEIDEVKVKPQISQDSLIFQEAEQSSVPEKNSYISNEESTRVQATIRLLREERDEILGQIKSLKNENRQLEQDNLTLISALDESKLEISILRKRHLVELEDIKYHFALNEEKKLMAEEKARAAEARREKLEQRVRIDFNQVKQREKELETKLEMLTIDVDSQVQSRDHKILELRRKIDSLEFNMENVSIKEHKSQDDKRKLEDKLNKIIKTLRHSIKNLEEDIDQSADTTQDVGRSSNSRSGKV